MYCSWQRVPGYASHFDTMDVVAIQIEGEKLWNIYEGRFSEATFSPGIRPSDFTPEQITGMKGRVAQQIVMRPGDILSLPLGVFPDAEIGRASGRERVGRYGEKPCVAV